MDRNALERINTRLAEAQGGRVSGADVETALERARAGLESLAETAGQLEAAVPERLGQAVQQGMTAEVLPVARHIAEVRGLTAQVVRRLEGLGGDIAAERRERVEDLALLVDLVASGWRGVERRLDRLERVLDWVERALEERPGASLYRIEGLGERRPGA
jgi:hypothetical protein